MKFKLFITILFTSITIHALADQWDDTFNVIVAEKATSLPYSLGEGYEVFDITYDTKQRIFTNHIHVNSDTITQQTITQAYQQDMPSFCNTPGTIDSLNSHINYQFIFYKEQTTTPFLTIQINKKACDNLKQHRSTK